MRSPTELITCPTLREADGLAMSSRNMRLSPEDRKKATTIYKSLTLIKQECNKGIAWPVIKEKVLQLLTDAGFTVDYVELADANTLQPAHATMATIYQGPRVALIAAFLHDVRLIDNMLI
jgi:pantoate--beta-alanine ligase